MLTAKDYDFLLNEATFDSGSSLLRDHGYEFYSSPDDNVDLDFYYLPIAGKPVLDCPIVSFNHAYSVWVIRRFE